VVVSYTTIVLPVVVEGLADLVWDCPRALPEARVAATSVLVGIAKNGGEDQRLLTSCLRVHATWPTLGRRGTKRANGIATPGGMRDNTGVRISRGDGVGDSGVVCVRSAQPFYSTCCISSGRKLPEHGVNKTSKPSMRTQCDRSISQIATSAVWRIKGTIRPAHEELPST
jgi:hypothetical protein